MKALNIVLSGYGRMGKEVEKAALAAGHHIIYKIDNVQDWVNFSRLNLRADVVIDFSMPAVALNVFSKCFEMNIPLVTGTTGWYNKKEEVFELCKKKNAAFFYAPNFSIGVNVFFYANKKLAEVMNNVKGYDVSLTETHHIHKVDAPSGTAIQTANDIIDEVNGLSEWSLNEHTNGSLPIKSIRKGEVTGTHEVLWKSANDEIILKHEAFNRSGFAQGAIMAAQFIQGKIGIFNMKNLLDLND